MATESEETAPIKGKLKTAKGLKYTGQGASLPDVPARDLDADEAKQYDIAALVASGLYEEA